MSRDKVISSIEEIKSVALSEIALGLVS